MNKWNIYYVSTNNGETEYLYIAENADEVSNQLEGDEKIVESVEAERDITSWPTNRRLTT